MMSFIIWPENHQNLHGLNDKWVAHHGVILSSRPGHGKVPTERYIIKRKTNLLIRLPKAIEIPENGKIEDHTPHIRHFWDNLDLLPKDAKFISIPINEDQMITLLYITKHEFIENLIAAKKVVTHPLSRKSP